MHPIDRLLFEGREVSPDLIAQECRKVLPAPGASYWGDAVRALFESVPLHDLPRLSVSLARSTLEEDRARIEAAPCP